MPWSSFLHTVTNIFIIKHIKQFVKKLAFTLSFNIQHILAKSWHLCDGDSYACAKVTMVPVGLINNWVVCEYYDYYYDSLHF